MTRSRTGRLDFHLHSHASNVTDYYTSNVLSIPESYSDPVATYHNLKARGMDLVTLTDHNSIDGGLELLERGLPGVFLSSELTTTFPEDGCNIHVTVANLTPAQFREADRLRPNVYELIAWLDEQIADETRRPGGNRLAYFMTHPLMSTQNRSYGRVGALTVAHLEKALLLCNALEVRNGTRARSFNELTARLLASLTPKRIEQLADRHGIEPKGATPWRKSLLAGSDDHSGINQGETWTEFPVSGSRASVDDVIDAIRAGTTVPRGEHGGPVTLAHAVVKLLFDGQYRAEAGSPARSVCIGGPLNLLLHEAFGVPGLSLARRLRLALGSLAQLAGERLSRRLGRDPTFERVLLSQARAMLRDRDFRATLAGATRTDDRIHHIISTLLNRIFVHYVGRLSSSASLDLVRLIKEGTALVASNVFVSLPYFVCYSAQSADKLLLRDVRKAFKLRQRERLLLVTDTLFEINGVSRTIRKLLVAAEERGIEMTVATCVSAAERERQLADPEIAALVDSGRLALFTALVNLGVPEYAGLELRFAPFLEFLKFAQDEGFTRFQLSTPGPMGLAGLLASRILQVESSATYHTSFPEYVEQLTRDISLEAITWKLVLAFYHAVDEVVVPSRFIAQLLHRRGLRKRNLLVLDRWVDPQRFHPGHRQAGYWSRHGWADDPARVVFVHVGRVSVEKNTDVLARAWAEFAGRHERACLAIIGDGPARAALEAQLAGPRVRFTGFLEGDELATAIASADVKLFPSTTDTWGNAPLEAQASGLPVVVTDQGGPQELMLDGVTGLRVAGGSVAELVDAMERLMDDELRRTMGAAARRFVEDNVVAEPYSAILDPVRYRKSHKARARLEPQPGDDQAQDVEELGEPDWDAELGSFSDVGRSQAAAERRRPTGDDDEPSLVDEPADDRQLVAR